MFKDKRAEIIIFFISFVLSMAGFFIRLAALPQTPTPETKFFYTSDSRDYLNPAKNLIDYHSLSTFPVSLGLPPDTFRPPGYPLFLALFYYLKLNIYFIIIVQNIISAIATVVVYRIGKNAFSSKIGWLSALLFAAESEKLHTTNAIMADILAAFLFFISLAAFVRFFKEKKLKQVLIAGSFLGLATLTRPATQAIIAIYALFIILTNFKVFFQKKAHFLKVICILLFSYAAVILPWSIRNYAHFKDWRISPELGLSVYLYAASPFLESKFFPDKNYLDELEKEKSNFTDEEIQAVAAKDPESFFTKGKFGPLLLAKALKELNFNFQENEEQRNWRQRWLLWSFNADEHLTQKSIEILKKYPFHFAAFYARDTAAAATISAAAFIYKNFDIGGKISDKFYFPGLYYAGKLVWLVYYIFILLFFILFFRKKTKDERTIYLLFCVIISYFLLLLSLGGSPSRYRIPANPLIFMLFAVTLFDFINYFKSKLRRFGQR